MMGKMICNKAKECKIGCQDKLEHEGDKLCSEPCSVIIGASCVPVPLSPQEEGVLLTDEEIKAIPAICHFNQDGEVEDCEDEKDDCQLCHDRQTSKAQLAKVVKWLEAHRSANGHYRYYITDSELAALKKEAGK